MKVTVWKRHQDCRYGCYCLTSDIESAAQPEMLAAAAGNLQAIGSAMATNNSAAAGFTTGVVPQPPMKCRR